MKLFLYSFAFTLSDEQAEALSQLVGKPASDITMALIDNAAEIIPDSAGWVGDTHAIMQSKGYVIRADYHKLVQPIDSFYALCESS